jgi:hypothetical protein
MQTHTRPPAAAFARPAISLSLLLLLAACDDSKVTAYRVAKETPPPEASATANAAHDNLPSSHPDVAASASAPMASPGAPGMANTAVATASGPGLAWTAPAHWAAKPGSAMRKGSYAVTGEGGAAADLSITAFPGDVGGEFANVNRWRGQLQLTPLSEADTNAAITRLNVNGLSIAFVDLANPTGEAVRLLGAMIPYQGSVWFFKLTGPDALVAKEKPAFVAFLNTIKPAAASAP